MNLAHLRGLEERLVVDTSEGKPVFMLIGARGSYLRISESAYQLLRQIGRGVTFEQLAEAMCAAGKPITAPELEAAYRKVAARIEEIEAKADRPRGGFWFRLPLLPARVVARLAAVGAAAFHPIAAALLVPAAVVAVIYLSPAMRSARLTDFWPSYGLFIVSVLVHELGHASACARFGARPSEIGFTVYVIYPSFYSDVSSAWGLKRWQRVVVDLGGVYFQILFGAACAVAYAATSWTPILGCLVFIAGSCAFSLNPILKFDGYWVIADALGVTNLASTPLRIARHVVDRARGRDVKPLPWSARVTIILFVYAALTLVFWCWFLYQLGPHIVRAASRYVEVAPAFGHRLLSEPGWPDTASLKELGASTFLLFFPILMLGRMAASLIALLSRKLRRRGAPAAPRT